MDAARFENEWRDLVSEGHTEGEAFDLLEAEWPTMAAEYMQERTDVLLREMREQMIQNDDEV